MVEQKRIDGNEALLILEIAEGHFADVKRAEIAPAKLSESISAFANAAGGELYIGIAEVLVGDGTENNGQYLREQFSRNPKLVRLINKFPDPPNKDIGEGLNTAFEAMRKLRLKEPEIIESDHSVLVHIRHTSLASPQDMVMSYLKDRDEITNRIARELTGITSENVMKDVFLSLNKRELLERVPDKKGNASAWRKFTGYWKEQNESLLDLLGEDGPPVEG